MILLLLLLLPLPLSEATRQLDSFSHYACDEIPRRTGHERLGGIFSAKTKAGTVRLLKANPFESGVFLG